MASTRRRGSRLRCIDETALCAKGLRDSYIHILDDLRSVLTSSLNPTFNYSAEVLTIDAMFSCICYSWFTSRLMLTNSVPPAKSYRRLSPRFRTANT